MISLLSLIFDVHKYRCGKYKQQKNLKEIKLKHERNAEGLRERGRLNHWVI